MNVRITIDGPKTPEVELYLRELNKQMNSDAVTKYIEKTLMDTLIYGSAVMNSDDLIKEMIK